MKKFFSILITITILLGSYSCNANDLENSSITLKPGLNSFSTPTIVKSISFSNGGNNIIFSKIENGKWTPVTFTNSNVKSTIYPLNGYIIRNNNSSDVLMNIEYDINTSTPSTFSKNLDTGWNFLGITKTENPFSILSNTVIDFTIGETNKIDLSNLKIVTSYMLGKAYGVFVNSSNTVYEGKNIFVDNIDKQGPNLLIIPNEGRNVTGVTINIYDTNNLRSGSIIKYKWQKDPICNTERSGYTELSVIIGEIKTRGYVSVPTNGLNGEYYLCIYENTVFDVAGNGNISTKSDKFIFEDEEGDECQEICESIDADCPDECRVGILTDNSRGNVQLIVNDTGSKTVYEGRFNTKRLIKINSINIYGNTSIPEGDVLSLSIYINEKKKFSFQLTGDGKKDGINLQKYGFNITMSTGTSIPLKIKAKFSGLSNSGEFNYKFKLLGEDLKFYEINPQTISITVTGDIKNLDNENGDSVNNENYMEAYNRANNKGILNNQIITNENLNKKISNIEVITFITDYAKNILNREIDEKKDCSFINTENLSDDEGLSILESCQLGLIQQDDNMPLNNNQSNISMLATLLSRSLWNDKYDGGEPYYQQHLDALKIAGIFTGTINPEKNELKGDVLTALMNSEGKNEHWRVANSYDFMISNFNAVEDIYHNIKQGDRVIFLVRHSERIRNCTSEGGLTELGIELARGVGEKLQGAPFEDTSTDFYGSSTVKRTVQTSYYIGESRNSDTLKDVLNDDAWNNYDFVNHSSDINGVVYGNYFSDGISYSSIEHLYEENRNIVNERALNSIDKLCRITSGHSFSWITSHDWFTLPITERATNENLTFSQSKSEWPNFMQGVAIIVHEDGGWEIYPVRSLESGKMNTQDNPSCS